MQFRIIIKDNWKEYRYLVEHIPIDKAKEHFKLIANNKTLLFESNRPLFRGKGIRHRKGDLKLIEGEIANIAFLNKLCEQIQAIIETFLD